MKNCAPFSLSYPGIAIGVGLGAAFTASNGAAVGIALGAGFALLFGRLMAPKK